MPAETVLKKLGLHYTGTYTEDGAFVVDLANDSDFGKVYSVLDDAQDLDYQEDNSTLTADNANLNYIYGEDEYLITLMADFENEHYQLTLTEI